jgi:hypothetical protein
MDKKQNLDLLFERLFAILSSKRFLLSEGTTQIQRYKSSEEMKQLFGDGVLTKYTNMEIFIAIAKLLKVDAIELCNSTKDIE